MIAGARPGAWSLLRRGVACASRRTWWDALVVPGPECAQAAGLDLEAAGFRLAVSPRHAQVLVMVGAVPVALREAAAVLYAGMMRPRLLLGVGTADLSPLPRADVVVACSQQGLRAAAEHLGRALRGGAFRNDVVAFEARGLCGETQYTCPMHPGVVQETPGSCPICGMDLVARERAQAGGPEAGPPAAEAPAAAVMSPPHTHATSDAGSRARTGLAKEPPAGRDSAPPHTQDAALGAPPPDAGAAGGAESGNHFMSMVAVTRDLPRSADGLPMDWIEVPFGPLFPGLPGGLLLAGSLDGDTVARMTARSVVGRSLALPMAAAAFVQEMASWDRLAPVAYGLLALRAVEAIGQRVPGEAQAEARVGRAERERVQSHLRWLAGFMRQLGLQVLARSAGGLANALACAPSQDDALDSQVRTLVGRVRGTPLLARRLASLGPLPPETVACGPVARAAGRMQDARRGEQVYAALGYEPATATAGEAGARLDVHLEEIERSLTLLARAAGAAEPGLCDLEGLSGTGEARIETPRGEAHLWLQMEAGRVMTARIQSPSTTHVSLVGPLTAGQELGDALIIVGSLDLSPWEVLT